MSGNETDMLAHCAKKVTGMFGNGPGEDFRTIEPILPTEFQSPSQGGSRRILVGSSVLT